MRTLGSFWPWPGGNWVKNYKLKNGLTRAVAWMEKNPPTDPLNGELARFRAEAEKLLGVVRLKRDLAERHFDLGDALLIKGQVDEAIAELREAIRLKPDCADPRRDLVDALRGMGRPDETIAELREAIRLKPDLAEGHCVLGYALRENGQLDEAIAECREAIRLKPDLVLSYTHLSGALWRKGQLGEAIASCRQALKLDPNFLKAHNNLAWMAATSPDPDFRDPEQAVISAKKVLELDPCGNNWNTVGAAYYAAGDWKAAIDALNKSIELRNGGDSFDWFFLSMAHRHLGDKKEARKWYDRAIEWMEKNKPKNEELVHFRAEAEKLLGVKKDK
jgi:tetratricopeptide (TPR) repeat protein